MWLASEINLMYSTNANPWGENLVSSLALSLTCENIQKYIRLPVNQRCFKCTGYHKVQYRVHTGVVGNTSVF